MPLLDGMAEAEGDAEAHVDVVAAAELHADGEVEVGVAEAATVDDVGCSVV